MAPNQQALRDFEAAQADYRAGRFEAARERMAAYRAAVDYAAFAREDRRPAGQTLHSSVVLVSYGSGAGLLACLRSLDAQIDPHFEIILVDQGGNASVHGELAGWPLLWIRPPINLLPSEGRNLGAAFARGELLIFLDDDAIARADFVAQAWFGMHRTRALAMRGRILPHAEQSGDGVLSPHYDLGAEPCLAPANIEGNLVVRRTAFAAVRGFDPLVFGHEGRELGWRLHQARQVGLLYESEARGIYYWPWLVIRHDFAVGTRLEEKRARQARGRAYLEAFASGAFEPPEQMDPVLAGLSTADLATLWPRAGVTLLLRTSDDLRATKQLLQSLVDHNTQRPLELVIVAPNATAVVAMIRPFLTHLSIQVLSAQRFARLPALSEAVNLGRYAVFGLVSLEMTFATDPLPPMVAALAHKTTVVAEHLPKVPAMTGALQNAGQLLLCHRWALGCLLTEPPDAPIPQLAKTLIKPPQGRDMAAQG